MICIVLVLVIAIWALVIRGMLNHVAKRVARGLANG